jgi:hypothetical protein
VAEAILLVTGGLPLLLRPATRVNETTFTVGNPDSTAPGVVVYSKDESVVKGMQVLRLGQQ